MTVEDALAHRWTEAERQASHQVNTAADVIGGPDRVRALIDAHVAEAQADEVIVTTNTFSPEDRYASYERLAAAVGLSRRSRPGMAVPGRL
jgi:alkanesulfonate monooxygenase SsuD/methylene tetrahydromethanopterin reductase-like flavin-dependent oxidoreductase (luciferase family)